MGFHINRISKEQLALYQFAATLAIIATSVAAQPNCIRQCGDVSIPYPFGLSDGCNINGDFLITCNLTANPPKAFLGSTDVEVVNVSVDGYLRVKPAEMGYDCYNASGSSTDYRQPEMVLENFYISHARNTFIGIGCDLYAYISGSLGKNYSTGCISFCNSITEPINGSCTGIGCCQTAIPQGVRSYKLEFSDYYNHQNSFSFNPCSYGFVVENGAYNFSTADLPDVEFMKKRFPISVDWSIGNQTCLEIKRDKKNLACKENSVCVDPENGPGYICNCQDGFEGNPYLSNGCQDVDECKNTAFNNCEKPEYCVNRVGNYTCNCPKGYEGDGRKNGKGCFKKQQVLPVALGISIGFVALVVLGAWSYMLYRRRMLIKLKQYNFVQNGGPKLQQLIGTDESSETAKIFTAEQLEKATKKYDKSMEVGRGGFAVVYMGILEGDNRVAIKKPKNKLDQDKDEVNQFINEVAVLSKIKHKNVVKLLGCCFEETVPLLVYEYITKGTLSDHIHDKGKAAAMGWRKRLGIAAETAGVLSYLHSDASDQPIIHRDVKTTNILLDDNDTAKVSDFGASRLVPKDQTQLPTMVQGTLGYLDPEYLHTQQLTEKSDVYSFGVVLAELLTGRQVLVLDGPDGEKNLAKYFLSSLAKDRLFDIVERHLVDEENSRDQITNVAKLAERCLAIKGDERPSMKEVAMELEGLRLGKKHSPVNVNSINSEETEGISYDSYSHGGGSNNNSGVYGSPEILTPLNKGR